MQMGTPTSAQTRSTSWSRPANPRAAEEQARTTFAATAKGAIITVSVRAKHPPN